MPSPQVEPQDLIERFLAAYNSIDAELRHRLQLDPYESFSRVVEAYSAQHRYWPDAQKLRRYAELRNFLAHGPTQPYKRLAIPTQEVVADIEQVRIRLSELVLPRFQRNVLSLREDTTLAAVLGTIAQTDFSQFPVYTQDGEFVGLLTENGITRWLAHHTVRDIPLVDFDEIPIADVFAEEETLSNHRFIARTKPLGEVVSEFGRNPLLEAVLITHNGKPSEELLGIVTRWDLLT